MEDPGRDNDDGEEDDLFVYETGRRMRAIKREREHLPKRRKVKKHDNQPGGEAYIHPLRSMGSILLLLSFSLSLPLLMFLLQLLLLIFLLFCFCCCCCC